MVRILVAVALSVLLGACGGGSSTPTQTAGDPASADIRLLFFGNSHTHQNDVAGLVRQILPALDASRSVAAVTGPDLLFLDERLAHGPSLDLFRSQRWTAVVLQAQRYSSSGTGSYSTSEAVEWVRLARAAGAVPVLFPEWPRRGIDETARIFDLYGSIAQAQPACVPPIPQAFDIAAARDPALVLHAGGGNHASPTGALLAALVIAAALHGRPAADVPLLASTVDADTQTKLREAAAAALAATSAWASCPGDQP